MYLFSYGFTRGIVHAVVFTIDYCHVFVFITNTFVIANLVNYIFIPLYRYECMHCMLFPLRSTFVFVVY